MSKRKPQRRRRPAPSPSGISVRRTADGRSWVLVHPRCARDRAEDLDEVRAMIDAGEVEIARDELRWLLADCSEFLAAHVLLGELAVAEGDINLARGHFGAAYQLGLQTLRRASMPGPLACAQPANRPFFEAGRGLIWCLEKLGQPQMTNEILQTLLQLDSSDPMQLRPLVDELRGGGQVIDLSLSFPQREDI